MKLWVHCISESISDQIKCKNSKHNTKTWEYCQICITSDKGLSGWRLDVANEVSGSFWQAARDRVKKITTKHGDEPLLLGEIWQDGSQFLTGDQFDSVMNYKLSFAIGDLFLNQGNAAACDEELTILRQNYPKEAIYDLMNIVDSHDTFRAIYKFGGGKEGIKQATLQDFDYDYSR